MVIVSEMRQYVGCPQVSIQPGLIVALNRTAVNTF